MATGYGAGTTPSAIAADPSSRFVYVTDQATNQLYGNLIGSGGPLVADGQRPIQYRYASRGRDGRPTWQVPLRFQQDLRSIGAYAIDQATGTPVSSVGSAATGVRTAPTCIAIEPALGSYLYTSNNLDNSIGALQLDSHTGALKQVQNTPFPSSPLPTCVVAVANGSHPMQIVNP